MYLENHVHNFCHQWNDPASELHLAVVLWQLLLHLLSHLQGLPTHNKNICSRNAALYKGAWVTQFTVVTQTSNPKNSVLSMSYLGKVMDFMKFNWWTSLLDSCADDHKRDFSMSHSLFLFCLRKSHLYWHKTHNNFYSLRLTVDGFEKSVVLHDFFTTDSFTHPSICSIYK